MRSISQGREAPSKREETSVRSDLNAPKVDREKAQKELNAKGSPVCTNMQVNEEGTLVWKEVNNITIYKSLTKPDNERVETYYSKEGKALKEVTTSPDGKSKKVKNFDKDGKVTKGVGDKNPQIKNTPSKLNTIEKKTETDVKNKGPIIPGKDGEIVLLVVKLHEKGKLHDVMTAYTLNKKKNILEATEICGKKEILISSGRKQKDGTGGPTPPGDYVVYTFNEHKISNSYPPAKIVDGKVVRKKGGADMGKAAGVMIKDPTKGTFVNDGIFFHDGNENVTSHGCFHVNPAIMEKIFETMNKTGFAQVKVIDPTTFKNEHNGKFNPVESYDFDLLKDYKKYRAELKAKRDAAKLKKESSALS
jgi:hypothetical protein